MRNSSKIIFTIQHPAHVHLFRNPIKILQDKGVDVHIFVRTKDIATELLDSYDIEYKVLAGKSNSVYTLAIRQVQYELRLLRRAGQIRPDLMVAMGEPAVAHVSSVLNCPSFIFTDTEYAWVQNILAFPYADSIFTPICYQKEIGRNQIYYPGYHELAYLHPNRFTPDPDILKEIGFSREDPFVIFRLNAWNAVHFLGDSGIKDIEDAISRFEEAGVNVVITSEPEIKDTMESYHYDIPVNRMHDLMYYADLVIGESSTMAAESAVLGTPAVFISTSRRGYTDELGDRYGLVFTFSGADRQEAGLNKAIEILSESRPEIWQNRREQMLEDKIDTTEFMLEKINYVLEGNN